MSDAVPAENSPMLRTLSPALRGLERGLRGWLDAPHRYPLSAIHRATLEGLATDLRRSSEALDVDRPLLVVMLMGGTGVGKSTLLNALAGGNIAQASFTRPTTRDPVVYYHESVRTDRLDPALRHCRLVAHDRPALEQKVLVDTPDVDSNDLANREKLLRLLPVADVVLYVGSQEKYHDQLVWELFLQQRRRRAFAFVLNKWDRCLHTPTASGVRPDEDLIRDLEAEGFQHPLLFRTCAQLWVDRQQKDEGGRTKDEKEGSAPVQPSSFTPHPSADPPEGEQFLDLVHWLELGLSRLEVEAIKARGVSQLLAQTQCALEEVAPPDLSAVAERTRAAWSKPLGEEASATAEVLLNTLEPYQREIEHHFALEGQRRFHGLMAWYLQLVTRARYLGSNLKEHLPLSRGGSKDREPVWDLSMFTRACSEVAGNRMLDARGKALANRLLVEANNQGFPLEVLDGPVEALGRMDWRQKYATDLYTILVEIEKTWTQPRGLSRLAQSVLVFAANWLPPLALLAALANLLARLFRLYDVTQPPGLFDALMPLAVLLAVLVILHLLIMVLMPLRWSAIREEFHSRLEARLKEELEQVYSGVPGDVAEQLREERRKVEQLIKETREVADWLAKREQSASVAGLYGN